MQTGSGAYLANKQVSARHLQAKKGSNTGTSHIALKVHAPIDLIPCSEGSHECACPVQQHAPDVFERLAGDGYIGDGTDDLGARYSFGRQRSRPHQHVCDAPRGDLLYSASDQEAIIQGIQLLALRQLV